MFDIALRKRKISWQEVAWVVPGIVFILWQVIAHQILGTFPLASSSGTGDLGWPFWGFLHGAGRWLPSLQLHVVAKCILYIVETLVTATLLVITVRRRELFSPLERIIITAFSLLFICETQRGWQVPFDNRYATVPLVLIWFGFLRGSTTKELRRYLWIAPLVLVTVVWRLAVI